MSEDADDPAALGDEDIHALLNLHSHLHYLQTTGIALGTAAGSMSVATAAIARGLISPTVVYGTALIALGLSVFAAWLYRRHIDLLRGSEVTDAR